MLFVVVNSFFFSQLKASNCRLPWLENVSEVAVEVITKMGPSSDKNQVMSIYRLHTYIMMICVSISHMHVHVYMYIYTCTYI